MKSYQPGSCGSGPRVTIELAYQPRTPLHAAIHRGMDTHRFGAVVTHRRFGKTVLSLNHMILAALGNRRRQPEPRYGFFWPFREQAKRTAWQYLLHYTEQVRASDPLVSDLSVRVASGALIQLFGADNVQSFRGGYFDGVVLDEYANMSPVLFPQIIMPTLTDFTGWCYFLDTPRGHNDFKAKCDQAAGDPSWFFARHPVSETNLISDEELAIARRNMTQDEYDQEYECSFEASVKGAIYATELAAARSAGRVLRVPIDPVIPVDTAWDLGVGDSTAIWFVQSLRSGEVRCVDYYESSGVGLPEYAQVLRDKGYTYGRHIAPFDIQVKELGSGRSRLETARSLGIQFEVAPNVPLEDGIHAARMLLPRCWFDETKCQRGLEALQHYRRDFNTRLNEFKAQPVHDWASHGADAFRYLALSQRTPRERQAPILPSGYSSGRSTDWLA